jgi:hypothetical protein
MPIPSTELLTLTPDAIIDFYVLDLSPLSTNKLYRFCNWKQSNGTDIVFQRKTAFKLQIEIWKIC